MRLRVGLFVSLTAVAAFWGCGGGPSLVPVSGTVTLNGKPLRDAEIAFLPVDSSQGEMPGDDVTGPAGNFKAMTRGRSGLVPGKYKVMVMKTTTELAKIPEAFKDDPYMARLSTEGPAPPWGQAAPRDSRPTQIRAEFERAVEPGGGTLDFDIKVEVPK